MKGEPLNRSDPPPGIVGDAGAFKEAEAEANIEGAQSSSGVEREGSGSGIWLALVTFLIGAGGTALFLNRRRSTPRRSSRVVTEDLQIRVQGLNVSDQLAPPAAAPLASATQNSGPWLNLSIQPVRFVTTEDGAKMEFVLSIENQGSEPAENVQFGSVVTPPAIAEDSGSASSANLRMASLPVVIAPGESKRIATSSAVPSYAAGEALKPIVQVCAEYGSHDQGLARVCAAFEVGIVQEDQLTGVDAVAAGGGGGSLTARLRGEVQRA